MAPSGWEIYVLLDPRPDKRRVYVGATGVGSAARLRQHMAGHEKTAAGAWCRKLRRLGLSPLLAVVCGGLTEDQWAASERSWIALMREVAGEDCLNIADGGQCPPRQKSEVHKAKIRQHLRWLSQRPRTEAQLAASAHFVEASKRGNILRRGVPATPEQRERSRQAQLQRYALGYRISDETRAKQSAARKGKPGIPLSEETKRKISESNKGRRWTPERRAKQVAKQSGSGGSFYGRHHTAETKEKIAAAHRGKPGWNRIDETREQRLARQAERARIRRRQHRLLFRESSDSSRECIECGATFNAYKPDHVRCSNRCRIAAGTRRRRISTGLHKHTQEHS